MRFAPFLAVAALAPFAAPGIARAATATLVVRDVPLGAARSLAAERTPGRFELVGLHWRGRGAVFFRTRGAGPWSSWHAAAPEAEDLPDPGTRETARARGWRIGNPYWTGPADRIEYRLRGHVRALRAYFVASPVELIPMRRVSSTGSPLIVSRPAWGANERIRRAAPQYADAVYFSIVHHTAGSNSYTPAQSAAIVRAIEVYHVKGNGWNDIGYNFLVDKYGQVFEGRYGGIDRPVVGAHALGFNRGSVGVAVIGNYDARGISAAARSALVDLLAWRLDVAHIDPLSTLSFPSGGNLRFPAGVPVFLRAISGHRDTGFTDCPGDRLYAQLPSVARAVSATGLPKLYAPAAKGQVPGRVRFTARLSDALPWTVTVSVAAPGGAVVASGSGSGKTVDWTWDATRAKPGTYAYTIAAGPSVRSATGTVGAPLRPLTIAGVSANPPLVSPVAASSASTTIAYTLGFPATVTATLVDAKGTTLVTLLSELRPAGRQSFVFHADAVPDGAYTIVITASDVLGRTATASVPVLVSRALLEFAASPPRFSPNGDGRRDRVSFVVGVAARVDAALRVLRGATEVASVFSGTLDGGEHPLVWDGHGPSGRVPDGRYRAALTVSGAVATVTATTPVTVDTHAPSLVLRSLRPLRVWVSEPSSLVGEVDGVAFHRAVPAGTTTLAASARRVRLVAEDAAANLSRPVRR
jgi:hypothetical protein